jgi:hypothetical protein
MKYKTTAKDLKEGYYYIISVGYCELQTLLKYKSPVAYNAGTYGWNFDVYDVNGYAIVTGYRSMPSQHSKASYDLVREYEQKAHDKTKEELDVLIDEFIKRSIENDKL